MLSLTSAFVLSVLLISAVLGAPSSARVARRREARWSQLNNRLHKPVGSVSDTTANSTNWAGALWDKDSGTFSSVTGTFTVPTPSGENGTAAAVWVGIDGDTCKTAILQTGIDFTLSNGQPSYGVWYEWFPDPAYDFTGIDISGGDVIKLTVSISSPTSGNATVENLTSGQTVSESLTSSSALCGQNAEWIVEDFEQSMGIVPFANFGTVTFINAEASGNGMTYMAQGANTVNIQQNNQVLTSVSINDSTVTIQYV